MAHNRSCLHRLGSNAGPVEPGDLDPVGTWLFALAALLRHDEQIFLCPVDFGHRLLGIAMEAGR